jgi:hypothetical protein
VQNVETAAFEPVPDRAPAQAEVGELRAGDHPVLAPRERRDQPLARMLATFGPYFGLKVARIPHGPDGGGESVSVDRRIVTNVQKEQR